MNRNYKTKYFAYLMYRDENKVFLDADKELYYFIIYDFYWFSLWMFLSRDFLPCHNVISIQLFPRDKEYLWSTKSGQRKYYQSPACSFPYCSPVNLQRSLSLPSFMLWRTRAEHPEQRVNRFMCTSREALGELTKHALRAVILVKHLPCSLWHVIPPCTPNA